MYGLGIGISNGVTVGSSVSPLARAIAGATFYAPLTSSLALTKGTGSATFTRATTATVKGYAAAALPGDSQVLLTVAANEARFEGARRIGANNWSPLFADGTPIPDATLKGVVIEEARTNLFLQSAVGATQTTPVLTAAAYTLSFYGTGTIVGTGGFVGTLVGTGASNRVSLTVTATAATATLTVTGSCTNVQFELGNFTSSYIPTTTAAVARNADVLTYPTAGNAIADLGWASAEWTPNATMPVGAVSGYGDNYFIDMGMVQSAMTRNNGSLLLVGKSATFLYPSNSFTVASAGIKYNAAFIFGNIAWKSSLNGVLGAASVVQTGNTISAAVRIGAYGGNLSYANGNIRNVRIGQTALSDAQLQAITS